MLWENTQLPEEQLINGEKKVDEKFMWTWHQQLMWKY